MLKPWLKTALWSNAAPSRPALGASYFLVGETQGASFDFTSSDGLGAISVIDLSTAANNKTNVHASAMLSVTRNSTKQVRNNAGTLSSVAVDTPSINWDGNEYGLLVEAAATNLLLQSQDIATTWTNTNTTETVNATTAPDGTTTADKLVEASDSATTHSINQTSASVTSGTTYTFSVYLKAGERTWARLNGATTRFADNFYCDFNLATGAVGTPGAGATISGIESIGSGWYRCYIGAACDSTGTNVFNVFIGEGDTDITYDGDGTSGIYVWGAQLEAGSFPSSYIPTTTVTVTRAADVVTMLTSALPFSATEGTMIAHWLSAPAAAAQVVWQIDDTGGNERILAYRDASNNPLFAVVDGGAAQTAIDLGTLASSTVYKSAFAWKLNDCAAALNGGAATTDTSATLPTVTTLRFGADHSASELNSNIRRLIYVPRRMTDAELTLKTA